MSTFAIRVSYHWVDSRLLNSRVKFSLTIEKFWFILSESVRKSPEIIRDVIYVTVNHKQGLCCTPVVLSFSTTQFLADDQQTTPLPNKYKKDSYNDQYFNNGYDMYK